MHHLWRQCAEILLNQRTELNKALYKCKIEVANGESNQCTSVHKKVSFEIPLSEQVCLPKTNYKVLMEVRLTETVLHETELACRKQNKGPNLIS